MIALGIWGALIPFVGPYVHYSFGSNQTWHYTSERLWLEILPGAAAILGGLMMLRSAHRTSGLLAGWLALIAGVWFAVGLPLSLLWHHAGNPVGAPVGGYVRQAVEQVGYFYGLGVVIAALAAFATGRFISRPHLATEAAGVGGVAAADVAEHERIRHREREATGGGGLFGRRRAEADAEAPRTETD